MFEAWITLKKLWLHKNNDDENLVNDLMGSKKSR
jgi:hypothetical protein